MPSKYVHIERQFVQPPPVKKVELVLAASPSRLAYLRASLDEDNHGYLHVHLGEHSRSLPAEEAIEWADAIINLAMQANALAGNTDEDGEEE